MLVLGVWRPGEHHGSPAEPQQVDQPLQLVLGDGLQVGHLEDLLGAGQQLALRRLHARVLGLVAVVHLRLLPLLRRLAAISRSEYSNSDSIKFIFLYLYRWMTLKFSILCAHCSTKM